MTYANVQPTLHALRRSHELTLVELARLTGIPTRRLAEFEYADRLPQPSEREALVGIFGPAAWSAACGLTATPSRPRAKKVVSRRALRVMKWTAAAAAGLALLGTPLSASAAAPTASIASSQVEVAVEAPRRWVASPGLNLREEPGMASTVIMILEHANEVVLQGETQQVGASTWVNVQAGEQAGWVNEHYLTADQDTLLNAAANRFGLLAAQTGIKAQSGRLSCPVVSPGRRIVMTQGYGVGSHAPAETWGAIDLAPIGGATRDTLILAAHAGTVQVALNTWPAGNHVWVNGGGGLRTGYAHLQAVYVESGQYVEAGQPIGLMGSTGNSTGPHLHFHVWRNGVNVDPTPLVSCS